MRYMKGAASVLFAGITMGCSAFQPVGMGAADARPGASDGRYAAERRSSEPAPAPGRPTLPGDSAGTAIFVDALGQAERRIIVSRDARALWLMEGDSVLFRTRVAVGRDTVFVWEGESYDFETPPGRRTVQGKETDPLWVPPDWHYFEIASERGLEPVKLEAGDRVELSDGTRIEVRGSQVGRVNQYGNFWAFTPGSEIIFDGRIFIPPFGTDQRRVPRILGTHRLLLGDGYLIHGTPEEESIGEYASHGCVRLLNRDVERLYGMIDIGAPVFIY